MSASIQLENKAIVVRSNKEVIEGGSVAAFEELVAPEFVNRTAAPGAPTGPEGLLLTFNQILRPAFAAHISAHRARGSAQLRLVPRLKGPSGDPRTQRSWTAHALVSRHGSPTSVPILAPRPGRGCLHCPPPSSRKPSGAPTKR